MMKLSFAISFMTFLLIPTSAKAEIAEIINPSWQEIPGTISPGISQYNEPTYVNKNRVSESGNILTYDLVESDAGYARIEVNCQTNQYRAIHKGFFESNTRVNYRNIKDTWNYPTDSYKQAILKFICAL